MENVFESNLKEIHEGASPGYAFFPDIKDPKLSLFGKRISKYKKITTENVYTIPI